jgi:hypothetical protein
MSVDYAIVERARLRTASAELKALAAARFKPFFEVLGRSGLTRLREGSPLDINDYRQKLAGALGLEIKATD